MLTFRAKLTHPISWSVSSRCNAVHLDPVTENRRATNPFS
jgi:hypothetical protein